MGLFDFFKKKDKSKEKQPIQKTTKIEEEPIKMSPIDNGSHGDNFGGLIGFHFLNTDNGGQFVNEFR